MHQVKAKSIKDNEVIYKIGQENRLRYNSENKKIRMLKTIAIESHPNQEIHIQFLNYHNLTLAQQS